MLEIIDKSSFLDFFSIVALSLIFGRWIGRNLIEAKMNIELWRK